MDARFIINDWLHDDDQPGGANELIAALDAAGYCIASTVVCPSCKAEFLPAAPPSPESDTEERARKAIETGAFYLPLDATCFDPAPQEQKQKARWEQDLARFEYKAEHYLTGKGLCHNYLFLNGHIVGGAIDVLHAIRLLREENSSLRDALKAYTDFNSAGERERGLDDCDRRAREVLAQEQKQEAGELVKRILGDDCWPWDVREKAAAAIVKLAENLEAAEDTRAVNWGQINYLRNRIASLEQQVERLVKELKRAQAIIDELKAWREAWLTRPHKSTPEMRARIRELATGRDDFDRAVIMLLDDFEAEEKARAENA